MVDDEGESVRPIVHEVGDRVPVARLWKLRLEPSFVVMRCIFEPDLCRLVFASLFVNSQLLDSKRSLFSADPYVYLLLSLQFSRYLFYRIFHIGSVMRACGCAVSAAFTRVVVVARPLLVKAHAGNDLVAALELSSLQRGHFIVVDIVSGQDVVHRERLVFSLLLIS